MEDKRKVDEGKMECDEKEHSVVDEVVRDKRDKSSRVLFTRGENKAIDDFMAPTQVVSWKAMDKALYAFVPRRGERIYEISELREVIDGFAGWVMYYEYRMRSFWSRGTRCPDDLWGNYVVRIPALLGISQALVAALSILEKPGGGERSVREEIREELSQRLEYFMAVKREEDEESEKN